MSHFGFICPPFLGHLNPMGALAAELLRRGHGVSFLGLPELAEAAAGFGAGFLPIGEARYPAGSLGRLRAHMAAPRGLGLFRIIHDMSRMTDTICREAPAAVMEAGIDALVTDQLEPAGGLVAAHLGLAHVSVANALPVDREPGVPPPFTDWTYDPSPWGLRRNAGGYRVADAMMVELDRVIARWASAWGLPGRRRVDQWVSAAAQITQVVPGLDFPRAHRSATVHPCGPLRGFEAADGCEDLICDGTRPLVFASLGTLQGGRLRLFQRIATAAERLGLHLVVAHGGALTPAQEATLPGRPVVRGFVPQRRLLARAALAITNGGLNTVLDALAAGVPLVVLPIAFEQGAIGARLERCGAGTVVHLRQATSGRIERAMADVLARASFRAAAGRLAVEIAGAGGVARAAEIIEAVARRETGPAVATALPAPTIAAA